MLGLGEDGGGGAVAGGGRGELGGGGRLGGGGGGGEAEELLPAPLPAPVGIMGGGLGATFSHESPP